MLRHSFTTTRITRARKSAMFSGVAREMSHRDDMRELAHAFVERAIKFELVFFTWRKSVA
jgi:hypothetical protein